jgi:hypothetical protein
MLPVCPCGGAETLFFRNRVKPIVEEADLGEFKYLQRSVEAWTEKYPDCSLRA